MGKVLIIDDEKQILGLLSRIIGLEGYEVLQAATCKAGLRQMEQHSPEVVLCDVFLPDGNGVDLVSDLKKLRPLSEIILLTAHGNIPDGVQAIKNGAFDYITKGDDNNKIIPLVAKAMEKASAAYQQQKKEATSVGRQYSFDTIVGKSPAIRFLDLLVGSLFPCLFGDGGGSAEDRAVQGECEPYTGAKEICGFRSVSTESGDRDEDRTDKLVQCIPYRPDDP